MRVGSLFSGIGMIDLGLERAGAEIVWQVESDPFRRAVLEDHWPNVRRYEDVRYLPVGSMAPCDTICGGFPCQPVSYSGWREAEADPRWFWPEMARVLDEIRPKYVLLENVPGLATSGGAEVVSDLVSFGYDFEWDHLPASSFGAPHERDRFWLLAHSTGIPVGTRPEEGYPDYVWGQRLGDRGGLKGRKQWPDDPAELPESGVGRMAYGGSSRLDKARLVALGDSVVPGIAEHLGWVIRTWEMLGEI